MQIEHNTHEKRPGNGIWWVLWPMIALGWASYLYSHDADWTAAFLGLGTGAVLATWAIEITGNKPPSWWNSPRRRD